MIIALRYFYLIMYVDLLNYNDREVSMNYGLHNDNEAYMFQMVNNKVRER